MFQTTAVKTRKSTASSTPSDPPIPTTKSIRTTGKNAITGTDSKTSIDAMKIFSNFLLVIVSYARNQPDTTDKSIRPRTLTAVASTARTRIRTPVNSVSPSLG